MLLFCPAVVVLQRCFSCTEMMPFCSASYPHHNHSMGVRVAATLNLLPSAQGPRAFEQPRNAHASAWKQWKLLRSQHHGPMISQDTLASTSGTGREWPTYFGCSGKPRSLRDRKLQGPWFPDQQQHHLQHLSEPTPRPSGLRGPAANASGLRGPAANAFPMHLLSVKSLLWQGGFVYDAWFSCATKPLSQVLLSSLYVCSPIGMLSGLLKQVFYGHGRSHLAVILATTLSAFASILLLTTAIFIGREKFLKGRREKKQLQALLSTVHSSELNFSYEVLEEATDYFHDSNKLGEGGSDSVYKGKLPAGTVIAVKRLFFNTRQWVDHFFNEISLISSIQHKNLVRLLGGSITGPESLLVHEFVPNRSLHDHLFAMKENVQLSWEERYKIILGTAEGLAYLHEKSRLKIIHRDIKLSNVLLEHDFTPKIADFGLVKFLPQDKSHLSTAIAGLVGSWTAYLINVLLVGIASVDCVQIFSLHGLVPQLAGSLMLIGEVFGSCVPNAIWTITTGKEMPSQAVLSIAGPVTAGCTFRRLKDLADFPPASLAKFVSYFSAVTRGVWKPILMNGTDWPSPTANPSKIEDHIGTQYYSALSVKSARDTVGHGWSGLAFLFTRSHYTTNAADNGTRGILIGS